VNTEMNLRVHLKASQEGLSSVELVNTCSH